MRPTAHVSSVLGGFRASKFGRADRGAVAVEALLVAPVLMLMVFGMIDLTLLVRDHIAVTTLAREGARTASAEPRLPGFTIDAVDAIARSAVTLPLDNRVRILVYKATSSGVAPADADACGKRTDCVAYSLDPNSGKFVVTSGSWSPTAVNACIGDSGADYVGVSVRTTHDWLIGFAFPGSGGPGISSKTVMKFEPVIPRTDSEDFQKKCKGA